jgi:hypothetical protein
MSDKQGLVTGDGHNVEYKPNPNPHKQVPEGTPRTGVPVSPTQNAGTPRHPQSGQFVPRKGA